MSKATNENTKVTQEMGTQATEEQSPYKPDQDGWQLLTKGNRMLKFARTLEPKIVLPELRVRKALNQEEIEIIENKETKLAQNITMFDLLRPHAGALQTFIEVCRDLELCLDVVNDIFNDPNLQKTPTKGESTLFRFTSLLYHFIETTYMRWSLSYIYDGSGATNINIADHWVNLKLSKTAAHREEEESDDVIDSEHIALKLNEGVIVVVKGEPGMGKSTLVRKLCFDWMFPSVQTGKSKPIEIAKYLSKYSLILPVELRSVKNCDRLIEMSLIYLLERLQLTLTYDQCQELLNEIYVKAANGEILMILDGFDEQNKKCDELQNILTNQLYMPPCPLLITTRPEQLNKIDAAIEIVNVCGLTYDEQLIYIDVYCKNSKAKERMKQLIMEKNKAIQKPVTVPFFLAILCLMAEEQGRKKNPNILPFPEQLGNIFNNFLSVSHQRIEKKFKKNETEHVTAENLPSLEPIWINGFRLVGGLAFEAFKRDKKIFPYSDFKECSITRELCLSMEFLTTGTRNSLMFLNDTFQEFFACFHLHENFFKNYYLEIEKDMYSIDSKQRDDVRKMVTKILQELFTFRKIFATCGENCMQFLTYFDSINNYNSKMLWNNLNDNGQYVNEMNSNLLNRIKAADHFDKFKERLQKHYDKHILQKTVQPSQWVDLTYRLKREKTCDEMESTSFYELSQSLINRPILLYGSTMAGKTTTLASIVVKWCSKEDPWNKYDIVFFIPLSRFCVDCKDVFDLCLQYLLPKLDMDTGNDYLHTSLKKHLSDLGKKHRLLLLFDDVHLFTSNCQEITRLLGDGDGKMRLPADMIISASLNYMSNLKLGPVGMLHVKGFTEFDQVKRYGNAYKCMDNLTFKHEENMDECFTLPGLLKIFSELHKQSKIEHSNQNATIKVTIDFAIAKIWIEYVEAKLSQVNSDGYKLLLVPLSKFAKHLCAVKKRLFTKAEFCTFNGLDKKCFQQCVDLSWIMKEDQTNENDSIRFQFFNKSFVSFLAAYAVWRYSRWFSYWRSNKVEKVEQLVPYLKKINDEWNNAEKRNMAASNFEDNVIG